MQTVELIICSDGTATTEAPDGNKPIISGFTGSFGGDVVINGVFTAHSAAPDQFIRGQSALIGTPALAASTKYVHSAIDDYNGTGAVIHAHKSVGTTAVGVEGGGDPLVEFATAKKSGYVTGLIKIVSQHLSADGSQAKVLRFRNADGEALLFRTPQWSSLDDVTFVSMNDFVYSQGFAASAGGGTTASGTQLFSGEWIRFWMYFKASSAAGVRDGSEQMMQKSAQVNGESFFDYKDTAGVELALNDQRYPSPVPARFRPNGGVAIIPHPTHPLVVSSCDVKAFELAYYARDEQEHDFMYQDIWFSETPEDVYLHTLPTLTASFSTGKLDLVPYSNRTTSSVTVDTSKTGAFVGSDNIYMTVRNSNGMESNAVLLRAGA